MSKDKLKPVQRDACSPEVYQVCWLKGTEQPFTGKYYRHNEPGHYHCTCCGQKLFSSEAKYDSGTGWPSFWDKAADDAILTQDDFSLGVGRTEVLCASCGAHLGHVFEDGPQPTGLRYCMNSIALTFQPSPKGSDASPQE